MPNEKIAFIAAIIICAAYVLNTYVLPASGLKLNLLDFNAKDVSDSEFRDSRLLNAGGFDVNFRGSITACFDKMCEKYGVVEIPVSTS